MQGPEIQAKLGLNSRGFIAGIKAAKGAAKSASETMSATFATVGRGLAAVFGARFITRQTKSIIDNAARVRDAAQGLGLTAEEFQAIEYAAKQSGSTVDDVARAIKGVGRAQYGAAAGQKEYQLAWEALGYSMDDVKSKGTKEIFMEIARQVESGAIGLEKMSALERVMGEGARELWPAMVNGIAKTMEAAAGLGVVVDDLSNAKLAGLADQWTLAMGIIQKKGADAVVWLMDKWNKFYRWHAGAVEWLATYMAAEWGDKNVWEKAAENAKNVMAEVGEQQTKDLEALKEEVAKRAEAIAQANKAAADALANVGKAADELRNNKAGGGAKSAAATQSSFRPISDNLARIGGFVGRDNLKVENLQKMIASHTKKTAMAAEETVRQLKKGV